MTEPTAPVASSKTSAKKSAAPHPSARFAHLVAELATVDASKEGDIALEDHRGAALLLAHMCCELGREKVFAMKRGEAKAYLLAFRSRYPLACQALDVCDVVRFVYRLEMYGAEHDSENDLRAAINEILPPPARIDAELVDAMAGVRAP